MRTIALWLAWAAMPLAGCSSMAYKAAMPDVSANCVAELKALPARPLTFPAAGKELREHEGYAEFASLAGCYRPAGSNGVPVAVYRLESLTFPAEVKVSVSLSTGGTFAAALDVLDEQWRPLRRYGFEKFVRRGSLYSLDAFLNADGPRPAYLVLAPDDTQVGKKDTRTGAQNSAMPILAGPVIFTYHNSVEVESVNPLLQGGRVRIVARPHDTQIVTD